MDNNKLGSILSDALAKATFVLRDGAEVNLNVYRELYAESIPNYQHCRSALRAASVNLPDTEKNTLVMAAETTLSDFIKHTDDNNLIGYGPTLANVTGFSTIGQRTEQFALDLLRMAALRNPDFASQKLYAWRDGEPITFTMMCVLKGVEVEQECELQEGIRFMRLPKDTGLLYDYAPRHLIENMQVEEDLYSRMRASIWDARNPKYDILGASAVCIDVKIEPVFFHLDEFDPGARPGQEGIVTTTHAVSQEELNILYMTISITCDTCAYPSLSWCMYNEGAFFSSGQGYSYSLINEPQNKNVTPMPLKPSHIHNIKRMARIFLSNPKILP